MVEAALSALSMLFSIEVLPWILLGTTIGFIIGVLPALGGSVGLALVIPFVWGMEPASGIALLVGILAVTATSDTFTSILIGVPGAASSQATVLDGYALARKGDAARALGASFSASLLGGVIGAFSLVPAIMMARPYIRSFGSPELFMLCVLGIATVGMLVKGDVILGLFAAVLGVMLGTIGSAPGHPQYRYAFGELYLYPGLPLVIVALGLFAIPEALALLIKRTPISSSEKLKGSVMDGGFETLRHKKLVLQSSLIGTAVGVIPGLGGAVVNWIAYAFAKQTARDPSQFGRGDIRGVIAPEAANNSEAGGALIPTLVLGIPGGGATALFLGGLILMGIRPGPDMLGRHLDLTLLVMWSLVLANVLATAACFLLARYIARLTLIPGEIMGPFLLVMFVAAAYQGSTHFGDIVALVALGLLGFGMKLVGMPRAPVLIGFVLSTPLERYLQLSHSIYGFTFLQRPLVIVIGLTIMLMACAGPFVRYLARTKVQTETT